jgi:putative FmdB family regulatory protein
MPTYEYECRGCGGRVEAFQKMSDDPLTTCETCGGALRRLLFPAGIIFKGPGFYVNDYKNKEAGSNGANGKSRETSTADTKTGSETSSTEKSSTESKPAETKAASTSASSS